METPRGAYDSERLKDSKGNRISFENTLITIIQEQTEDNLLDITQGGGLSQQTKSIIFEDCAFIPELSEFG